MKKYFLFITVFGLIVVNLTGFSLSRSLFKAGDKYIKEKNFIGAQKIFTTVTVLDPENNKARSKLIQVMLEMKDYKKALREVHMALSFEGNNKEFLKLKNELENKVKLEENPKKVVKKKTGPTIKLPKFIATTGLFKLKSKTTHLGISAKNRKNYQVAFNYYENQKYEKAIVFFEKILKSPADKDNLSLNQFAGETYFWLGKYKRAVELLNKVVKVEKKNIEARVILSYAYMAVKKPDYKKALKYFNEVLKIKKDYVPALVGTGICYLKSGKEEKAEPVFNKVIRLDPKELRAYYGLSDIYLKKKLYEKAMSFLHSALAYVPDSYQTIEKIGDIYVKMKDYKTAAYIFRKAMDYSPSNPDLMGKLCITLLLSKQNFTAGLYLGRALKIAPENDVINFAHGMFWEANIDFQKAVNAYRKALAINYHNLEARFYLINLLMGNSNVFPNAAKLYENRIVQVKDLFEAEEHINELYAIDKNNLYKEGLKDFEIQIFNLKADLEEKQMKYDEMYDIKVESAHQ